MKHYVGLLLLVLSTSAVADTYYRVIGYQCDQKNNLIVLTQHGAYNEAGEDLVDKMGPNQWDLWSLVESKRPVKSKCHLDSGDYEVTISTYLTGSQCKACFGIHAKVNLGSKNIFDGGLEGFEQADEAATSRIVIKSHEDKAEVVKIPWKTFGFNPF